MNHKLDNYLLSYRKRSGLSQDEVAALLGTKSGTKISRYECSVRLPALETVFAYEVIFGAPVRDLFAGIYDEVERDARRRIKRLIVRLKAKELSHLTAQKLAALEAALVHASKRRQHRA